MIKRHTIELSKKNTNFSEKQTHENIKLDFCGVYPSNQDRGATTCIDIGITHYFDTTSRTMYGSVNLDRDEVLALYVALGDLLHHDNWKK